MREKKRETERERRTVTGFWKAERAREKRRAKPGFLDQGLNGCRCRVEGMTARYREADRTRRRTPLPTVDRGWKIDEGRRREKEEMAGGVKCM